MAYGDLVYSTGGALAYGTGGALVYSATVAFSGLSVENKSRSGIYESPNYFPAAFPDGYPRSTVLTSALSAMSSASWSDIADDNNHWSSSRWYRGGGSGTTTSNCTLLCELGVYNTSAYNGDTLHKYEIDVTSYNRPSGAGQPSCSVRVSTDGSLGDPSTSWVNGDDSIGFSGTGIVSSSPALVLDDYLIVVQYISGWGPPTTAGLTAYAQITPGSMWIS